MHNLLVLVLCLTATFGTPIAQAQEKPPNIVFILADDPGFADTSVTAARTIRTPHIDGLATDGLATEAYSASPICSPTRTALVTGRYPQRYEIGLEEPLISSCHDIGLIHYETLSRMLPMSLRVVTIVG